MSTASLAGFLRVKIFSVVVCGREVLMAPMRRLFGVGVV